MVSYKILSVKGSPEKWDGIKPQQPQAAISRKASYVTSSVPSNRFKNLCISSYPRQYAKSDIHKFLNRLLGNDFYSALLVDLAYIRFCTKLVVLLGARRLHLDLKREMMQEIFKEG